MDLSEGLTADLKIVNLDYEWTQALDCENISFRCRAYYNIGHLAKSYPKTSQSYRHQKATWWMGAHPEHYTILNEESTQLEGTGKLQPENTLGEIQAKMEPQIVEQALEVSAATMENSKKPSGVFTRGLHTIASPEISEWKLVTKNFSRAATVPRELGGHKGTPNLSFGTLKLPSFLMEKSGQIETSGNIWKKKGKPINGGEILIEEHVLYRG